MINSGENIENVRLKDEAVVISSNETMKKTEYLKYQVSGCWFSFCCHIC
jgi:hypothetical protein